MKRRKGKIADVDRLPLIRETDGGLRLSHCSLTSFEPIARHCFLFLAPSAASGLGGAGQLV